MQTATLFMLVGLGLLSTLTLGGGVSLQSLENALDPDSDITDIDQAVRKANLLRSIAAILEEDQKMDEGRHNKRFLEGLVDALNKAAHKVGEFFTNAYNQAQTAFYNLTKQIDFNSAVATIVPLLTSKTTLNGCKTICTAGATSILGPAAPLAGTACSYVCEGALAEIQKYAG